MKPEQKMENPFSKENYLQRKAEQLKQWERVLEKITLRVEIANDKNKPVIRQHIKKIRTLKSQTEFILEQLQKADNERWESSNINLEKNMENLRNAFLESSKSFKKIL